MPLENNSGARSLGVGFWGLLVGAGPWGQPCHLAHHMVASVPWYQQIILHRHIVGLLTVTQRKQLLLKPIVGFPALLWASRESQITSHTPPRSESSPAMDHRHARSTMH
jgi:hypothetical protein